MLLAWSTSGWYSYKNEKCVFSMQSSQWDAFGLPIKCRPSFQNFWRVQSVSKGYKVHDIAMKNIYNGMYTATDSFQFY